MPELLPGKEVGAGKSGTGRRSRVSLRVESLQTYEIVHFTLNNDKPDQFYSYFIELRTIK